MSAACPTEFIKAQAVSARSWAYVAPNERHQNEPYVVCNDDHCQRYQGTTNLLPEVLTAVNACKGEFLVDKNENVISAYYSKSCGGHQESVFNALEIKVNGLSTEVDSSDFNCPDLTSEDGFKEWLELDTDKKDKIFCSDITVTSEDLPKYLGAVDEAADYFRWKYKISNEKLCKNLEKKFNLREITGIQELKPGKRGSFW